MVSSMNPLAEYIKQKGGSLYRRNPVIQRIAEETGYSVETVYRAAIGAGTIRSRAVEIALGKYKPKEVGRHGPARKQRKPS